MDSETLTQTRFIANEKRLSDLEAEIKQLNLLNEVVAKTAKEEYDKVMIELQKLTSRIGLLETKTNKLIKIFAK